MDKELEEKLRQRLALEKKWRSSEEPEPKTESILLNTAEPKEELTLSKEPNPTTEHALLNESKPKVELRLTKEPEPKAEQALLNESKPKVELRLTKEPEPTTEQECLGKPEFKQEQAEDIENFKKALEDRDHQNIINLLTKRSGMERLKFKEYVEYSYATDSINKSMRKSADSAESCDNDGSYVTKSAKSILIKKVKKKLKGDFQHLIVAILTPLATFYAEELRRAFKGLGTTEDAVLEILCTVNNDQLQVIKKHFVKMYKRELVDDIKGDTSGSFGRLLECLSKGERDECPHLDIEKLKAEDREAMVKQVKSDAQALYEAGVKRWGTDESVFCQILCQRSHVHLRLIFEEYIKVSRNIEMHQHKIEAAIETEFTNARDRFLANYHRNQDVQELIEKVFSDEEKNKYEELVKTQEVEEAIENVFLGDKKNVLEEHRKNRRIEEVIKRKFSNDLENVLKEYRGFLNARDKAFEKYRSQGGEAVIKEMIPGDENVIKKYNELVKIQKIQDQKNAFEDGHYCSGYQMIEVINWNFLNDVTNALRKYRWLDEITEIEKAIEELFSSDKINIHEKNRRSHTKSQGVWKIFASHSKSVLEEDHKHTIEAAIENEFSGDIKNALLAIVESVQNKPKFFAQQLHNIMKEMKSTIKTRFRTSIRDVIRIVVTRCERDMADIKKEYFAEYDSSLAKDIEVGRRVSLRLWFL
jgi:hypothetical protein